MTGRKRFRILNRDGFACRYCGRKAPDVMLQVDHIVARSRISGTLALL
jgi:5-methylcytosine-specific restriction endonuclease McrA